MIMSLVGPINSGLAAGGAGVATSNKTTDQIVRGRILAVYVKYLDSPPATTDVTVETAGVSAFPAQTILSLVNAATDVVRYPVVQNHDTSGVAVTGEFAPVVIHDKVKVTIAQANDDDSVDVTLLIAQY